MSDLRDQLQALYEQHDKLTPEIVVEAARPKDHPLHAQIFDRPPPEAAEAWYRIRARELIKSVKVVYRDATDDAPALDVRAFHAVRASGPDAYIYEPVEKIAADPFTRQLLLREMEREWRQLFRRYEKFEEFLQIVSADLSAQAA